MDVCDVSNVPAFVKILRDQKQKLRKAEANKGQHPYMTLSRDDFLLRFIIHVMVYCDSIKPRAAISPCFFPLPYAPCVAPLSTLKKVLMRQLTIDTHHRGSYIVVRAVTPVHTAGAAMIIVEDEERNVLLLQWYNQDHTVTDSCLPEGTVLIIKEPFVGIITDKEGPQVGHGLRVDHPSDLIIVPNYCSQIPLQWKPEFVDGNISAKDWWYRGSKHFIRKNYYLAIEE